MDLPGLRKEPMSTCCEPCGSIRNGEFSNQINECQFRLCYLRSCTENNLQSVNHLNAELNPVCHLLALLGAHHIFHVSGLRVKHLKTEVHMNYTYL